MIFDEKLNAFGKVWVIAMIFRKCSMINAAFRHFDSRNIATSLIDRINVSKSKWYFLLLIFVMFEENKAKFYKIVLERVKS